MITISQPLQVQDALPLLKKANNVKDPNKRICTVQDLLIHLKNRSHDHGPEKIPPICVIIDDCSVEKRLFLYNGIVDELFLTGRNYNISTIVVAHRLNLLSRNVKLNINFACLFPCVNYSEVESFIVQFCDKTQRDFVYFAVSEIFKEKYHFVF